MEGDRIVVVILFPEDTTNHISYAQHYNNHFTIVFHWRLPEMHRDSSSWQPVFNNSATVGLHRFSPDVFSTLYYQYQGLIWSFIFTFRLTIWHGVHWYEGMPIAIMYIQYRCNKSIDLFHKSICGSRFKVLFIQMLVIQVEFVILQPGTLDLANFWPISVFAIGTRRRPFCLRSYLAARTW